AFTLTQKPTHLVIIGGGPLGMELAQAHRRLGAAVTVIEASTPLAQSDPELVDIALRRMQEEGVVIRSGTNVVSVAPGAAGRGIELTLGGGDVSETILASHLLIAVGRELNLNELDLDKANVKRDPLDSAMLALRSYFKTSNRRVYAVGALMANAWSDAAAAHQAQAVVRHALLGMPIQYDRQLVPLATYCDPEIAEVGLTEPMARKRLQSGYKVVRCAFADNARARAERQSFGLAKLVTDRDGRILGAGIVGANAGELIALFSFAIANRLSTHHLRAFVPAHPTFSEIVRQLGTESAHDQPPSPWLSRLMALNRLLP
ncbi:MAG: dihydrolipoyl dehydrogenase, partial [Hyphomicrobiales bacterium]|nr:dihydrolipoyl dehydrogenase [Hyphomicrobiales bacterium]